MRFFRTISIGLIAIVISFAGFLLVSHSADGVLGWLWGGSTDENIGCAIAPCAPTLDNATGVGWMNPASGSNPVVVPDGNGPVTGYAWSSNVGWIDFSPEGPYPAAPDHGVERIGSTLQGWARVVSIAEAAGLNNAGGWEGWIKLSPSYNGGVQLKSGMFEGFAWSGELGWIEFTNAVGTPPGGCTDLGDPNCTETGDECADGVDNDGDGDIDAFDADCSLPGAIIASCSASPTAPEIGDTVTWTAIVFSGGGANPAYAWTLPGATSVGGSGASVTAIYSTEGVKTAQATITNPDTGESATVECTVQVYDDLNQQEENPFFPFF